MSQPAQTRHAAAIARAIIATLSAAVLLAAPLAAQHRIDRFPPPAQQAATSSDLDERGFLRPLNLAKWGSAAAAVGAGVWGFVLQDDAEGELRALETLCNAEPQRCRDLLPDGRYADPALERRYSAIRGDYRMARRLLVVSQLALAGSVALFILDLPDDDDPPNIPYDPPVRLDLTPDGAVELRGTIRTR